MKYVEYSKQRFDSALAEIERLKQSEFPYEQISESLELLETHFKHHRSYLEKLTPNSTPDIVKNVCVDSLNFLFRFTPKLGFILRATNVRNGFEIYAPFVRLSRQLLGQDTKLILSSEWDYSPFIYLATKELQNVVLIGVPAFESSNPLLVSLAGHELGHNLWEKEQLIRTYEPQLRTLVLENLKNNLWSDFQVYCPNATIGNLETDMFVQQAWLPALMYATRQLEEVFCDMVGLRLFGSSYLNAFAYLLSPGNSAIRATVYPKLNKRVEYLLSMANEKSIEIPEGYDNLFEAEMDIPNPVTALHMSAADPSVETLAITVARNAFDFIDSKNIPSSTEVWLNQIFEH